MSTPEDDEADEEPDALELWGGEGAVRLLRYDPGSRATLMERAEPGIDISTLPDEEATSIAVDVAVRLWRRADDRSAGSETMCRVGSTTLIGRPGRPWN